MAKLDGRRCVTACAATQMPPCLITYRRKIDSKSSRIWVRGNLQRPRAHWSGRRHCVRIGQSPFYGDAGPAREAPCLRNLMPAHKRKEYAQL